eukprot:CAMPEP_0171085832 /NCGR_PEP_ID=MMETSP0766_2-20121228/19169_1 /TAXON_ID=439317 /ORGANISM="Gambierdiscus australes, Strain CAWD 149" /LENGTH=70 /DNA_ID=CAMNT_0011543425 /DNA_START=492 /DNA_END=701 /DNA_ORIENTATION=-
MAQHARKEGTSKHDLLSLEGEATAVLIDEDAGHTVRLVWQSLLQEPHLAQGPTPARYVAVVVDNGRDWHI